MNCSRGQLEDNNPRLPVLGLYMYSLTIVRSDYGNLEDLEISVRTTWLMTGQTRPRNAGDDKLLPSPNHRIPHDCIGSAETRRIRPTDVFNEAASHMPSGYCQPRLALVSCIFSAKHALCRRAYDTSYQLQKAGHIEVLSKSKLRLQFYLLIRNCKEIKQRDLWSLLLSGFSTHLVNLLMAPSYPCAEEPSHLRKKFHH